MGLAPICPSQRCSGLDDNQSLAMATYRKILAALPYRIQCREYNADYNADYNDDYNTGYNAISISKLRHQEYSRMRYRSRFGDPELHNYDVN